MSELDLFGSVDGPREFRDIRPAVEFCCKAQRETGHDWRIYQPMDDGPFVVRVAPK